MSGTGDRSGDPGDGAAGAAPPATFAGAAPPAAGPLLVIMEPAPVEGRGSSGTVLAAEGARLAAALGVEVRRVTWEARPDSEPEPGPDPYALADALAGAAARERAVAVLLADTDTGRVLAPLVASRLGSGAVIGCSDVVVRPAGAAPLERWSLVFAKPVYGGWLERETEAAAGTVPVATLDLTGLPEPEPFADTFPVAGGAPAANVVSTLEVAQVVGPAEPRVRRLELVPPDPRLVDLVYARRIVAAGSGSVSGRLLAAARELAELLQGSVGATRPVVDDGLLPKERLIGQTGRTVAPELYLALGLSGSPHHVAGVRRAGRIVAINRDPRAPIFQFADVGYVADLEVVLPALVKKIKEYRDGCE